MTTKLKFWYQYSQIITTRYTAMIDEKQKENKQKFVSMTNELVEQYAKVRLTIKKLVKLNLNQFLVS